MSTSAALAKSTALPAITALIDGTRAILDGARSAAEVLEAREMAGAAADEASRIARFAKKKKAGDEVIAAAYRLKADALEMEAGANRRLADEYDAAQPEGAGAGGRPKTVPDGNGFTAKSVGLSRKEIHEARIIRDAERSDPGIVRRALDDALAAGEEPSKARVRRAALETARPETTQKPTPRRGKDAIRERVLEAIMILSGLPPAHEVVGYFAGTDTATIISERLHPAASWLAEFNDAWRNE